MLAVMEVRAAISAFGVTNADMLQLYFLSTLLKVYKLRLLPISTSRLLKGSR